MVASIARSVKVFMLNISIHANNIVQYGLDSIQFEDFNVQY